MEKCKIVGMVGLLIVCATPLVGCGEGSATPDTEGVTVAPIETEATTEEPTMESTTKPTVKTEQKPTSKPKRRKKRKVSEFIVVNDPLIDLGPDEFVEAYAKLPDDYEIHLLDKNEVRFSFLDGDYDEVLRVCGKDGVITKKQAERVTQVFMLYGDDVVDDMEATSLSLRGLRYFQNINALTMELRILSSYSEFEYLGSLAKVKFTDCEFGKEGETGELSCLFAMPGMEEVFLGGRGLTNVDFLSGYSDLGNLNVVLGGDFSDISGLSSLKRAGYLNLTSENLTDISALSNLTEVDCLDLSSNSITDISALSNLTEVNKLDLSYNQISDISALSKLTEVGSLMLFNNQITDIKPLSGLREVREIVLSDNLITDATPLSKLTEVVTLSLSNNRITDVTPLSGLRQAYSIGLSNNPLTDISPLRNLVFVRDEETPEYEPAIYLEGLNIDKDLARKWFGDYCYFGDE